MPLSRQSLCGPPHVYALQVNTALDLPRLAESGAVALFLEHLETIRHVFDARVYAWRIEASGFSLIIRHRSQLSGQLMQLQQRWKLLGGKTIPRGERLIERVTSLCGLMQTLLQTASRRLRARCGGPGTWWAPRYRSCLLSDDSALIASVLALEHEVDEAVLSSSCTQREFPQEGLPQLATLPLCVMPDGEVLPRDTTPMGVKPPPPGNDYSLLNNCLEQGADDQAPIYAQALSQAWALGRPESLSESMARLGRQSGRGRSRRIRELDDDWGLCGVWG